MKISDIWKGILGFFKSDLAKQLLALGEKILKAVAGQIGSSLMEIAKKEVAVAEATGVKGAEKYEIAFKAIRKHFPNLAENAVNLAIELCVAALKK